MKNLQVRDRKPVAMRILSGDTEHIDGIILTGSVGIRAKDLHAIVRERVLIEKKFQAVSMGYHELKHQIREIMCERWRQRRL
jgi:hypothetical protein